MVGRPLVFVGLSFSLSLDEFLDHGRCVCDTCRSPANFPLMIDVPTFSFLHFLGQNLADMQPTILFTIYASQLSSLWPIGPVFVAAIEQISHRAQYLFAVPFVN